MLLQQNIEHVSIVHTCNTYFVMHWSMLFIQEYLVNVLIQYRCVKKPLHPQKYLIELFDA